jgi:hypothetical protein
MGGEFQHVLWNFFVGDFSLAARGKQSNRTRYEIARVNQARRQSMRTLPPSD